MGTHSPDRLCPDEGDCYPHGDCYQYIENLDQLSVFLYPLGKSGKTPPKQSDRNGESKWLQPDTFPSYSSTLYQTQKNKNPGQHQMSKTLYKQTFASCLKGMNELFHKLTIIVQNL